MKKCLLLIILLFLIVGCSKNSACNDDCIKSFVIDANEVRSCPDGFEKNMITKIIIDENNIEHFADDGWENCFKTVDNCDEYKNLNGFISCDNNVLIVKEEISYSCNPGYNLEDDKCVLYLD